jgi:hypothetical protein
MSEVWAVLFAIHARVRMVRPNHQERNINRRDLWQVWHAIPRRSHPHLHIGDYAMTTRDERTPAQVAEDEAQRARAALEAVTECSGGMCAHCIEEVFERAQPAYERALKAARLDEALRVVELGEVVEQQAEIDRLKREYEEAGR